MLRPYYENEHGVLYHGDCLDVMDALSRNGFVADLLLTDPPYGIGLQPQREGSRFHGEKIVNDENIDVVAAFLPHAARLTNTIYMFVGWSQMGNIQPHFEKHFKYKNCLVWDKQWLGMGGNWRPNHELIMYGIKGHSGTIEANNKENILRHRRVPPQKLTHSCEKPVPLLAEILMNSKGNVVLDPFAGSGSTLEAAEACGWRWVGVEYLEGNCELIAKRLSATRNRCESTLPPRTTTKARKSVRRDSTQSTLPLAV